MNRSVRKQKGSRNFQGKYRLSNGPKIYYVALKTPFRHVAEEKLKKIVREQEEELAGLISAKPLRDAAERPLTEHLAEFLADLKARGRCKSHVAHTRQRLPRLLKECSWHLLRDVSADGFSNWRVKQEDLSAKTCNEYLGHQQRVVRVPCGSTAGRGELLAAAEPARLPSDTGRRAVPLQAPFAAQLHRRRRVFRPAHIPAVEYGLAGLRRKERRAGFPHVPPANSGASLR